jgi:hypothetical protein
MRIFVGRYKKRSEVRREQEWGNAEYKLRCRAQGTMGNIK